MDLLEPEELQAMGSSYGRSLGKLAALFQPPAPAVEKKASTPTEESSAPEILDVAKIACALELVRLNAVTVDQAAALVKSAAVTPEQARRSLDRLDSLERNKPTAGQLARYGTIGGLGGAAIGAVGNAIESGTALKGATPKAKALNLAANAAKGALGGGAIPLLRMHSDRRAEMGTLRKFMQEPSNA